MSFRMERVNDLLRQEISRILFDEITDPRITVMISITRVETSKDLKYAKVFVSVMGDDQAKKKALAALKSSAPFIHRAIRPRLSTRNVPFPTFLLDESIEKGAEMQGKINRVIAEEDARAAELARAEDTPPTQ